MVSGQHPKQTIRAVLQPQQGLLLSVSFLPSVSALVLVVRSPSLAAVLHVEFPELWVLVF